ncbi:MAG: hypothetical protein AAF849_14205 [Bacteroidota bacterium]
MKIYFLILFLSSISILAYSQKKGYQLKSPDGTVIDEVIPTYNWSSAFKWQHLKVSNFQLLQTLPYRPKVVWQFAGDINQYTPAQQRKMRTDSAVYFSKSSNFKNAELYKVGMVTNKFTVMLQNGDGYYIPVIKFRSRATLRIFKVEKGFIYLYDEKYLKFI